MTNVVIMRGLPGVGKSTYIARKANVSICSADMYPGLYDQDNQIDPTKLAAAHDACFAYFCECCEWGSVQSVETIYVDNTNTTLAEMAPYRMVARRFKFPISFVTLAPVSESGTSVSLFLAQRNVHNVPQEAIRRMAKRWEGIPSFWEKETIIDVPVL